jgi:hypothetical protein
MKNTNKRAHDVSAAANRTARTDSQDYVKESLERVQERRRSRNRNESAELHRTESIERRLSDEMQQISFGDTKTFHSRNSAFDVYRPEERSRRRTLELESSVNKKKN